LQLSKIGVPWDVIIGMDATERRGFCIAGGIVEGGTFDWSEHRWKKPDA
jgi:hypothetical protein